MKILLALLLLIPSLSWGNNLTDKQISFTLFGFTIDEEFKKNQYQLKTLNPYQNNSDGKKCKIVDNESNYDYSCYVRTVTETWLLDEIKPPPEANRHFKSYSIRFRKDNLKVSEILAFTKDDEFLTKNSCKNFQKTLFLKTLNRYDTEENNKIYEISAYHNDDFNLSSQIIFTEISNLNTPDMYSVIYDFLCFNNGADNIKLRVSLFRQYSKSEIDKLINTDRDTSGF